MGLMFSQLVTLYLTPVFYTYMAALQTKLGHKRQPSRLARQPEPVATGD
jgi:HAE1 family hydrophobic/amphiphilic exporter-1